MNGAVKEKYELDKVVLLGFFALGLVLAYFHTSVRSRVALTKPLELPYTGITVRMPRGNGWLSDDSWQFTANAFTISSILSPSAGVITASVEVRYIPAPEEIRPDQQIERYIRELDGINIETGKIQNSDIVTEWAHIGIRTKFLDVLFGVAELPNGRQLIIETQVPSTDVGLVRQVFEDTVRAIEVKDNNLLENGREIVEKLKTAGIAGLLAHQGQPHFYLIKDEREENLGFLTELCTVSAGQQEPDEVRFSKLYHIKTGQETSSGHSLFQADQKLRQFLWVGKTDSSGTIGESAVQIELNENGNMIVESYMPLVSRSYSIGPAAIPEIFIEPFVMLFLESRTPDAIVDLIFSDGRIIPTRLSVINTEKTDADIPAAHRVRLDFLDRQGYYGLMYLDENKETFRMIIHRESTYITQRSDRREVLKYFPVWQDHFDRMEKQEGIQINEL